MNTEGSILTIAAATTTSTSSSSSSAASASASSCAADSEGKYDVFLSFRGIDTRQGFTDFLYNDLVDAGIYTFRDDNELRIGKELGPELIKAIEDSKIWIPVFSKNYANSKWCLIELVHIVKCEANKAEKIFPIFYDVDVSDVKDQTGSYEEAFSEHENNFNEETVKEWRSALNTVGKLKGYELKKETNGYQGGLVKKLVKDVLLELRNNYAHVPDDLVGMGHHIQEMTRLLQVDSDGVRIVGVHGMGGIGKTTVAKVIYNKFCDSFEGYCFLEDVRQRVKQHPDGLVGLQKQLVSKILQKRDFPYIVNVDDGIKKIKDVVHRKKVLIVLDDVDDKSQFDKLVGECNWFAKESRIIVTTRNKEVLNALESTCSGKGLLEAYRSYEPNLMTGGDSLKLFSKYAFMWDSPPEDYFILSQKVTSIAAGLPLVLVTLGSLFLGIRDKASWSAKLKKLEKIPDKDIMGKLKISFDALDDGNKKIFLDIACFFIGKDKAEPYYMWEDCEFFPEDGVKTLILRSLVKIGDDDTFRMHDQLRDLGRQIVREEYSYKLSRVWRPVEALKVFEGGSGVENVEALNLDLSALDLDEYEKLIHMKQEYKQLETNGKEYYICHLKGQSFCRLQNLRFLRLGCVILDKDFKNLLSNLKLLEWRCHKMLMPTNLNLENLVILNLSNSTITDKWKGWTIFKAAKKLKVLNLSACLSLIRGPNFSMFKDLESLTLHSCNSLLEVHGLVRLESLTNLNMKGCKSIVRLPDVSNMRMLKKLLLKDCEKLHHIEGLAGLVSLELLDMDGCKSIERLPDGSNLRMLKKLLLHGCEKLHHIECLGDLVSLEHLDMGLCKSIERLPDLSYLRMLKILLPNYCDRLHNTEGLGGLVSLEKLSMYYCVSMVRLPDLSNLRMLKILVLDSCFKLVDVGGLGGLISLEKLVMCYCYSIERLPDLSNMGKLKQLDLFSCVRLREIEGLSGLVTLETLNLSDCISLAKTLDFSCLKNLKVLKLAALKHWTEIRGLEELNFLQELDVSKCSSLEKLPDLSNLKSLKNIYTYGCVELRERY